MALHHSSAIPRMPIVHISLLEGRAEDKVQQCLKAVARTIHETLDAPLQTIRVYATPVSPALWVVGDRAKDEDARKTEERQ